MSEFNLFFLSGSLLLALKKARFVIFIGASGLGARSFEQLAAGEDLEGDDDGAEWPYEEDCYPKGGDEWTTRFYGNDQ